MLLQIDTKFCLMAIQLLKIIYTLLVIGNVSMVKSVSGVPRVVKIGKLINYLIL